MSGWEKIIGQEETVQYCERVTRTGEPAHAYIINGEPGSGKKLLARLFAAALVCENKADSPCMTCRSCLQARDNNHPDIVWLVHEKPQTISVDDIREQVVSTAAIRPYQSPFRIYIIDEAEKMTQQAQNALLKTLEEPPSCVVILLLTSNAAALLPTILSRCVLLKLRSVSDDQVKRYLTEQCGIDAHTAEICTAYAQGNIGKAAALATSESFRELLSDVLSLLRCIDSMEISEISTVLKEVQKHRESIDNFLDMMAVWYRDVLLYKATGDPNSLIFKEELPYLRSKARTSSYEGIEKILSALQKAKTRLAANVGFDLVMELLILTIKEN